MAKIAIPFYGFYESGFFTGSIEFVLTWDV